MKYGRLTVAEARRRGYAHTSVILLDGIPITDCVVFDDNEGWADVLDREDGKIVLNRERDGARVKRLYGEIEYLPNKAE